MKTKTEHPIRKLRKIIGRTQGEFAAMIGASKDAVVSWENERNKLSATFARRIELATGVDGKLLLQGVSVPLTGAGLGEPRVYAAGDFELHRKTEWGRSDEEGAARHFERCADALELLFRAAAKPAGGKIRFRLPGVVDSFIQWCEGTRKDFKLEGGIDEDLRKRKFKAGITQSYGEWRRMAKHDPAALKGAGFRDDRRKRNEEKLRLELEVAPGWAPGRSMRLPRPTVMQAIE
jgi:DNA-binding XRE family transcriptional regulator